MVNRYGYSPEAISICFCRLLILRTASATRIEDTQIVAGVNELVERYLNISHE